MQPQQPQQVQQLFDASLLKKYNVSGPRYTSYPTALEFHHHFNCSHFQQAITDSTHNELSLYVHIPFCHSLCYYCGCNKVVTRHRAKADIYLDYLITEINAQAPLFEHYQVPQLHLGGGTPSFLSESQMQRLIQALRSAFNFVDDIEISIEIDPREISLSYIDTLAELGFNRLSIGVQDTDLTVQKTINRVQSTAFIGDLITQAKQAGFRSVNVDLIYGLPHQTHKTFAQTLADVKAMNVDRISLFSYAHLPERFAAQRKLKDHWLPSSEAKFSLMQQATETIVGWGYELIGMDHFAKPNDELALAQKAGILHRNFQGYTTHGQQDLLGLGVSSISAIGDSYSQNKKSLTDYYQALDSNNSALDKGITLTADDIIRGHVIKALMCNLYVDKQAVNNKFSINFDQYFSEDLASLNVFINDGLIHNNATAIQVAESARLIIRNIAMSFDIYMKKHINQQRFSRVI